MKRVIVITVLAASSFCTPQGGSQEVAFVRLGGLTGTTVCTEQNAPLILLNWEIRTDTAEVAEVMAHELIHVRQMNEYLPGGCKAAQLRYLADPEFRFDQELEAYCVNARRDVALRGAPPGLTVIRLTVFMMRLHPTALTGQQVLARARACINRPMTITPKTPY